MDIIDIINNIQEVKNSENLFASNVDKDNLIIKGLEPLYPRGIPKGHVMIFYGDSESGKSLLSLNLVNENPDLLFVYVDTHMQINSRSNDNMLLFRTNSISSILSFFENVDENLVDVIILDDLSYIHSENESVRMTSLSSFLMSLFRICNLKNITLILLNTLNGSGEMYLNNNTLRYSSGTIVRLNETTLRDEEILISGIVEKSKYVDRGTEFQYESERM